MFSKNKYMFICIIILSAFISSSISAAEEQKMVANINGENITLSEIESAAGLEIYKAEQQLYQARVNGLKKVLISKLIRLDDKSNGLTQQQYITKHIATMITVSDEEIVHFANQQQISSEKLTQNVKNEIIRFLKKKQVSQQLEQWFIKRIKEHKIQTFIEVPTQPTLQIPTENAPYLGGKSAQIEIIEFSDFECPFCARTSNLGHDLVKKHGDKIKFIFKQFPLNIHSKARKAAEASLCANDQGLEYFWKFHDHMFANQQQLDTQGLIASAKSLNLNIDKFSKCLNSSMMAEIVEADVTQGEELGVRSTPSFYINGRVYNGERTVEGISEYLKGKL